MTGGGYFWAHKHREHKGRQTLAIGADITTSQAGNVTGVQFHSTACAVVDCKYSFWRPKPESARSHGVRFYPSLDFQFSAHSPSIKADVPAPCDQKPF